MSKSNRNQSLPSQPSQTSSTSSTTSLFDSALASVTEMASKSQDLADFAKEKVVKSSRDSLSRAFSLNRSSAPINRNPSSGNGRERIEEDHILSSSYTQTSTNTKANRPPKPPSQKQHPHQYRHHSDWGESIGATATNAFNTLESASSSIVNSAQKHKHNLFAKLESHSLSLSSALFGNSVERPTNPNPNNKESLFAFDEQQQSGSFQDPFDEAEINSSEQLQDADLEMLSNNSPTSTNTDPLLAGHSHGGSTKRKSRPIGTIEYTVEDNETLEKIALKWNTVPSEIHRLNRLVTRVIFPGQVLFVPDPDYVPPPPSSPPTSPPTKALPLSIINEINTLETSSMAPSQGVVVESPSTTTPTQTTSSSNNSHNSSSSGIGSLFKWKQTTPHTRPGHVEKQSGSSSHLKHKSASQSDTSASLHDDRSHERSRNKSLQSRHTLTEEEAKKLDQECMQRFLKINCKIVTRTKGCFDGVLIITPSALMFDPLPSSNLVAAAAKSNSSSNGHKYPSLRHSASIYDEASALIPIEIISNVIMYEDLALKDVQEYFDYQNDIESQHDEAYHTNGNRKDTGSSGEVCFDLHTDSNETHEILENSSSNNNKQTIKSDSGAGEESGLGGENKSSSSSSHHGEDGIFGTSNNPDVTTTPVLSAKSNESKETTKKSSTPVLENGGEIGDLSINDDSLLSSAPTTATTPSNNNLLRHSTSSSPSHISCYLCIKVNKNRDFITCPMNRKMKNRLSSEFWFQINDNSTDKICAFFLEWKADPSSHISDELGNESDEESGDVPHGQFRLVKQNEKLNELISDALASSDAMLKSSPSTNRLINKNISSFVKDWEIVNLKEYEQKLRKEIEIEKEYKQLPNLRGESTILKEDHLRKLNVNLIPRAVGYNWHLTFGTELHGFSLNTMYRLLAEIDSPCLLVVMDTNRNVFGAMSPCKLYQSEHYYGTGESFLFTFFPSFRIFKWTGENNFFIRGNAESIGFGCAEGYHGLWFDGDLLNGHTQRSKTYDNDMLTSTEYFTIAAIEVWTFSD